MNNYDCSVFVLADMASWIRWGMPSTWCQDVMKPWRQSILELLAFLRGIDVVQGWASEAVSEVVLVE